MLSCAALAGPSVATCDGVSSLIFSGCNWFARRDGSPSLIRSSSRIGEEGEIRGSSSATKVAGRQPAMVRAQLCARIVAKSHCRDYRALRSSDARRIASAHGASVRLHAMRHFPPETIHARSPPAPDRIEARRTRRADRRPRPHSDDQSARRRLHRVCAVRRRAAASRGFEVEYVRAEGVRGDNARYPRTNVVGADRRAAAPGPCVHFNSHIDVVEAGSGWTLDPFAGVVRDGRVYGRGTCDMKGGLAASMIADRSDPRGGHPLSRRARDLRHRRRGIGRLRRRRLPRDQGLFLEAARRSRDHSRAAQRRPRMHRPSRRVVGRGRDLRPHRARVDAVPRRLGDRVTWRRSCTSVETELLPRLATRTTAQPVEPKEARRSTLNINGIHGGQPETDGYPAPVVAHSCRAMLDRRFLVEEPIDAGARRDRRAAR